MFLLNLVIRVRVFFIEMSSYLGIPEYFLSQLLKMIPEIEIILTVAEIRVSVRKGSPI